MNSGAPRSPAVAPSSGLPYGYVPAYLPGSASLVEQLDQTLLIVLRDGRHLVGVRMSCVM
jgi:U6 snRNA-associated Sm-like protein LSm1